MRVVINAQLDPAASGGIAQVLSGLAHGFAQLPEQDLELLFVCSPASAEWLRPFAGPNARLEINPRPKLPPVDGARISDGYFESFDPDVVHFPYQAYTRVSVPTVFCPHDLQHMHLPAFFTPAERRRRDALFADAFRHASAVAVGSQWVKDDLVQRCRVPPNRVAVIPWGSPAELHAPVDPQDVEETLERLELTPGFGLYPAQTWPHKNHLRLVEAVHSVRSGPGLDVRLVCTGSATEHFRVIADRTAALGLDDAVRFPGRVSQDDLAALYRAARFVVIPTLFEAGSFPLLEAFSAGVPAAVSNVTSLPDIAGGAALLIDPNDVESIAQALASLWGDETLRRSLADRAALVVSRFNWKTTAQAYIDLYRAVAGVRNMYRQVSRVKRSRDSLFPQPRPRRHDDANRSVR